MPYNYFSILWNVSRLNCAPKYVWLGKIVQQRSDDARVEFRAATCYFSPDMFVFLDESGMLVGVHIIRCNAVIYLYYDATVLVVMHYKYG